MIDKPLSNRIGQMLGEQQDAPSDDALSQLMDSTADSIKPSEGVQVASRLSLIGKIAESLSSTQKVVKQGLKSTGDLEKIAAENADEIAAIEKVNAEVAAKAEEAAVLEAEKVSKQAAAKKRKELRAQAKLDQEQGKIEPTLEPEPPAMGEVAPLEKPVEVAPLKPKPTLDQAPLDKPQILPKLDAEKIKSFMSGTLDDAEAPIDVNWANVKNPEDVDYIFRKTQELFEKETVAAKRGVITDQEADVLAKSLEENYNIPASLLKQQIGTTYNVEQMRVANAVVVSSARNIRKTMQQIQDLAASGKTDEALLVDFVNQLTTHSAMQMNFKAAKSEAGRAFRAIRTFTDEANIIDVNALSGHIAELGGAKNIQKMVKALKDLTPSQQAVFIQRAGGKMKIIGNAWKEVYQAALISSPASLERALYGNMLQSFMRPIDSAFAATTVKLVDIPYKAARNSMFKQGTKEAEDYVVGAEAMIEMATFFTQIPRAFKVTAQTFAKGVPSYKAGTNPDVERLPAIGKHLFQNPNDPMASAVDFAGKVISLPYRGMMALDDGAKAVLSQQELRKLAARQAIMSIKNGANVEDSLLIMAKNIADPSEDVLAMVDKAAKDGTLQAELGNFGKFLTSTRSKLDESFAPLPVGTLLAPFLKTVINAEKQLLSRTPVMNMALKEVRDELAAGGARRQLALGKVHAGAAMMGFSFWATTEGLLTGPGPTNPKLKQQMKETTGWQEFSIKWGDTYYSYAGFEPIGGVLAVAATLAELGAVYGKDDDAEWDNLLLYATLIPFKYIGQLPFMEGLGNFVGAIEQLNRDPSSEEANKALNKFFGGYMKNMVGGVTPVPMPYSGLARQIERTMDPTINDVRVDPSLDSTAQLFDFGFRSWLAGTPAGSSGLAPRRNEWGEVIEAGEIGVAMWIFPFFKSREKMDAISQKIVDIGIKRGKPILPTTSRVINNIQLNDNEFSDLKLLMNQVTIDGKTYKQRVAEIVADKAAEAESGQFAGMAQELSSANGAYKKEAWNSDQFMSKYPDAYTQIKKNEIRADMYYDKVKREPKVD
jgi:hypothetical protein